MTPDDFRKLLSQSATANFGPIPPRQGTAVASNAVSQPDEGVRQVQQTITEAFKTS